jgi:hypothetical protein
VPWSAGWLVVVSVLALVLWGGALFLVVIGLEQETWHKALPTMHTARLRSDAAVEDGPGRGASRSPTCATRPDLRVYAVLRMARKSHRLPELPLPQIAQWLLVDADRPSDADDRGRSRAPHGHFFELTPALAYEHGSAWLGRRERQDGRSDTSATAAGARWPLLSAHSTTALMCEAGADDPAHECTGREVTVLPMRQ